MTPRRSSRFSKLNVTADGIMGPQTQKALKDFQQQKGLDANGQLDQKTLSALGVSGSAAGGASGKSSSSSSSSSSALPWEAAARPQAALPPSRSPSRLRRPPRRAPARRSSSGVKKYRKAESREALRFSFWHTDCSSAQMRPASHSEVETLLKKGGARGCRSSARSLFTWIRSRSSRTPRAARRKRARWRFPITVPCAGCSCRTSAVGWPSRSRSA